MVWANVDKEWLWEGGRSITKKLERSAAERQRLKYVWGL
jgi:hypothetical protein